MKPSINSEMGKSEAARCLHHTALQTAPTKEASHLLPVFAPSTPTAKLEIVIAAQRGIRPGNRHPRYHGRDSRVGEGKK